MDLTGFDAAIEDVETALPLVGTALAGVAVLGLGVSLGVRWVRGIRSAV
jgi:hypothetical protein